MLPSEFSSKNTGEEELLTAVGGRDQHLKLTFQAPLEKATHRPVCCLSNHLWFVTVVEFFLDDSHQRLRIIRQERKHLIVMGTFERREGALCSRGNIDMGFDPSGIQFGFHPAESAGEEGLDLELFVLSGFFGISHL